MEAPVTSRAIKFSAPLEEFQFPLASIEPLYEREFKDLEDQKKSKLKV